MGYDYVQAFTEGHSYNQKVASYLRERNIGCEVPDLQIAQNAQERYNLTLGEKDITLTGLPHILEVKSSRRRFYSEPEKFPYPNTIVDTVSSYESKLKKPCAYVLYSRPTGAMLAIGTSTKPSWRVVRLYDHYQNLTDDFYVVDKSNLRHMDELVSYLFNLQSTHKEHL